MSNEVTLVVNGFLKLSAAQRKEAVEELNKYINGSEMQKSAICETFREKRAGVVLGPTSGSCPCCGR